MEKILDVLIIEDSPDDAGLVELELEKSGFKLRTERIETAKALKKALEEKEWDIIISDYNLPGFDGLRALEIVRATGKDIPFILVSGTVGEEFAVESVIAGANDYVMKDNLKRIPIAVQREIRNKNFRDQKRIADEKIRISLREKDVMLKEIHHRVKNNLAVISALLSLQADHVEDEKSRILFLESIGRIKTMALIHEKLYQSEMLASVEMGNYFKELASSIEESFQSKKQKVKVHIEADDSSLDITKAIPCGLIINELLTNSFKHAFNDRREGNIYLSSRVINGGNDRYVMKVSDDGIGLPNDSATLERSSLGFTIIRGLASQISADLDIQSDQGTSISLTFKV